MLKEAEVRAWFPTVGRALTLKRDIRRFLKGISEIYPEVKSKVKRRALRWTVLKDRNWNSYWRRFFTPQKIAKTILITPPWRKPAKAEKRKVIEIEPGMAFGTGTHATTRGCLEYLEEVVRRQPQGLKGLIALDVGTGSGILAIALAKMGVRRVVALDNDPVALKVARSNVKRNRVAKSVVLSSTELQRYKGPFNVVVANLTAETIIDVAPLLKKNVARGGTLILAGILDSQEREVLAHFKNPFTLLRKKSSEGWSTLALMKEA